MNRYNGFSEEKIVNLTSLETDIRCEINRIFFSLSVKILLESDAFPFFIRDQLWRDYEQIYSY